MATLVLDNGAGTAKVGYSTDKEPKIIPNCVMKAKNVRTRIFIGDQIDECKDLSSLYYLLPFQKGYLVNWDIERQVWDHMFGADCCKVDFNETTLIVTEPLFNFTSVQEAMVEILFEEYQFKALYCCNAPQLSQYHYIKHDSKKELCALVVDSGYSFTHLVPYCKGKKLLDAACRINIGGKVLTNHLKEIISYRQLMVMDETYVINQMKEDVCYVSTDFMKDMETARKKGPENTILCEYVLPDYTHIKRGYVKQKEDSSDKSQGEEQIIRMNNERFAVPELLFHPLDVGIQEMGIAEAVTHVLTKVDEELHPHLLRNIVLTGGNCHLPGFKDRMYQDVRSLSNDEYDVSVFLPPNPTTYSWEGGCRLAQDPGFAKMVLSRQEYDEQGLAYCLDKFDV
ncbi:actin-related protein 6-like [Pomacea canaliculata]|uniref:actin-related protein 6-like n=1 Tax=Pomacea canaliculata TaxID=400727 RepID=UPI000D735EF1|nr:actin-related protein 6-like [Pomacea canaliculata]